MFAARVGSIKFYLEPHTQKCLREELKQDTLVVGGFEVSPVSNQQVDYIVTDSKGSILAKNNDISNGKFTFATESDDIFEICFISMIPLRHIGAPHEILLNVKHGVEAKTYEELGEAAKLKPMEVVLRKLEDLSDAVVHDFVQMREREKVMRDTNESTNSRVLHLGIFSAFWLFGLSYWQVSYLRRYFRSKKLIE
ncbi:hypothetical protein AAG570_002769 [Ranatra chinensis]|uniref:GOLD domain-containing protein n=1 Tax=Ranatra chinensis TaxID=642074 RepID=A0ABD0YRL2_9HEMI